MYNRIKEETGIIRLIEVDENNLKEVLALRVTDVQKKYVPSSAEILSRAWVHRNNYAVALASVENNDIVGLTLVYNLDEEPACYYLMEMLIDYRYQNKGYAQQTLKQIIEIYSKNPKYPMIELSVDRSNHIAIHTYQKCGFIDSGYVDSDLPQYIYMIYRFNNKSF